MDVNSVIHIANCGLLGVVISGWIVYFRVHPCERQRVLTLFGMALSLIFITAIAIIVILPPPLVGVPHSFR